MLKINKKAPSVIQIGLWPRGEQLDTVWFDNANQGHFLSVDIQELSDLPKIIADQISTDLINYIFRFRFVSAISTHHIWTKTLILPQQLNAQECEQQCRFILENELPVSIAELWFDYYSNPLKQGMRLDIFAVIRNIAKSYLDTLLPLNIEVLDHMAHCLLRAFHYLIPNIQLSSTLLLYQDEQGCLALQDRPHQLQLIQQTHKNLPALFSRYCEHYEEMPEKVVVYSALSDNSPLPDDWQQVHTDLPFIALGAALWQRDLHQDVTSD
ncbi:MAG TPA: competence protein ComA [Pasteurellaceae bacterium]|nr:competence protein ComA [Pasteurellaceae bacterium]